MPGSDSLQPVSAPPSPPAPTAPPASPQAKAKAGGQGGQGEPGTPWEGLQGEIPPCPHPQGCLPPPQTCSGQSRGGALGWGAREGRAQRGAALGGGSPWGLDPCAVTLSPALGTSRRVGQRGPAAHTKRLRPLPHPGLLLSDPLGWGDWSLLMSSGLSQHPRPRGGPGRCGSPLAPGWRGRGRLESVETGGSWRGGAAKPLASPGQAPALAQGLLPPLHPRLLPPNTPPTRFAVTLGRAPAAAQHPPGDTRRPKTGGGCSPSPFCSFCCIFLPPPLPLCPKAKGVFAALLSSKLHFQIFSATFWLPGSGTARCPL